MVVGGEWGKPRRGRDYLFLKLKPKGKPGVLGKGKKVAHVWVEFISAR